MGEMAAFRIRFARDHPMPAPPADPIALTRHWLQRVVIGLNLCPFAKAVFVKDQIRYVLSEARDPEALLTELFAELQHLQATPAEQTDTTLLIHPYVLTDFLDYNDFLDLADGAVAELDLEGEIQIASFHPDYRFADSYADAIENCSNRSPFPMLHLLREASVERAVEAFPDADAIIDRNLATLRQLGVEGWQRLLETPEQ
jgi:hypothetical protein